MVESMQDARGVLMTAVLVIVAVGLAVSGVAGPESPSKDPIEIPSEVELGINRLAFTFTVPPDLRHLSSFEVLLVIEAGCGKTPLMHKQEFQRRSDSLYGGEIGLLSNIPVDHRARLFVISGLGEDGEPFVADLSGMRSEYDKVRALAEEHDCEDGTTLNWEFPDMPVTEVLARLASFGGYDLTYRGDPHAIISIKFRNIRVEEALRIISEKVGCTLSWEGRRAILDPIPSR